MCDDDVWPPKAIAPTTTASAASDTATSTRASRAVREMPRRFAPVSAATAASPAARRNHSDPGTTYAPNVIAIAAGAVTGAGLGENARAALITRGLAELGRLVTALGGRVETVAGLSGLGDLLLTCTGPGSRNYSLGPALGQGMALPAILAGRDAVTEGVATAPALVARARGIDLPVCAAVAALLDGRWRLEEAIAALLARPRRDE